MTSPVLTPADRAVLYLSRVEDDPTLGLAFRHALVPPLRALAATNPVLAIDRLKTAARNYLPGMTRSAPTEDLARSVDLSRFWEFHLDPAIKARFRTAEDYRRYVEAVPDPAQVLTRDLSDSPSLVPADHSWLTRRADVEGLPANEIVRRLNVHQVPPLVMFSFGLADLIDSGVLIRTPCSLDAVLGDHDQWRPSGLPSGATEYLDGEIPRSALSSLELIP